MAELASKFNVGCVIQYYSDQWFDVIIRKVYSMVLRDKLSFFCLL